MDSCKSSFKFVINPCNSLSEHLKCFFSIPVVGYFDFFIYWTFLLTVSVVYCLIVFRTVMYFLGMGVYIAAMVDDLTEALGNLDKTLDTHSTTQSNRVKKKQVLAEEIQFHNDMIEYG